MRAGNGMVFIRKKCPWGSTYIRAPTKFFLRPLGYKRYSAKQGFYFRYIIRRNLRGMNRFLKTLQQLSRTLGWI